jgi:hypothetical protein
MDGIAPTGPLVDAKLVILLISDARVSFLFCAYALTLDTRMIAIRVEMPSGP